MFDLQELTKESNFKRIDANDLGQSQIDDHVISRVRHFVSKRKKLSAKETSSELPNVKGFLYDWN